MKSKKVKTSGTLSTKEAILKESLSLINENGMMDFRIDVLAMALNLSPGNITYHFAKKEDISISLWKIFITKLCQASTRISSLLDVKQSFLILQDMYSIMEHYKGVVMFVNSNIRIIKDPAYNSQEMREITTELFKNMTKMLSKNGYIDSSVISQNTNIYQSIIMQWSVNKSCMKSSIANKNSEDEVNYNALLALFSLYNVMNASAKKEFDYIKNRVVAGTL